MARSKIRAPRKTDAAPKRKPAAIAAKYPDYANFEPDPDEAEMSAQFDQMVNDGDPWAVGVLRDHGHPFRRTPEQEAAFEEKLRIEVEAFEWREAQRLQKTA